MTESYEGGMFVGDITIKAGLDVTKQTHSTPVQNTHLTSLQYIIKFENNCCIIMYAIIELSNIQKHGRVILG